MNSDELEPDLMSRAVAGEHIALTEILHVYYDALLRRIARKFPASLRGVMAEEDILQQTFTEVFQRIGTFEPRGKWAFHRWLNTIADHRLQDAVKAQWTAKRGGNRAGGRRTVDLAADSVDDLIEMLAGPQHTPSRSAARHEDIAAVQVGLASLREDSRRAIELRHIQGLSVAEAAKAMNKKPRAIRELCSRGLKELRVVLGRSSKYFSRR